MKKRGILTLAVLVVMIGGILAACAAPEPAPAPAPAPSPSPSPSPAPAPAPSPSPSPSPAPAPSPSPAQPEEVFNWKLVSMWSEAELSYDATVEFANAVREASNGRLDIETFSSGALMPYTEYLDAVEAGVVELSQAGGSYWAGKDTALTMIDHSSIVIGDYPRTLAWFWQGGGLELAREAYSAWNLHYVGHHMYTFAGESIVSKKPIRTFEDVEGFKMRAPETLAPVWDTLGADVLTIPGAEVYTALSTGLIEGSDWGSPAMNFRMGYAEIAPYYSKPGQYYMGGMGELVANMDNWNELPDDLKRLLETAGQKLAMDMWTSTAYDDLISVGKLAEAGAEMVPFEPELEARVKELIAAEDEKLAEQSPLAREIMDSLQSFLEAIGGR